MIVSQFGWSLRERSGIYNGVSIVSLKQDKHFGHLHSQKNLLHVTPTKDHYFCIIPYSFDSTHTPHSATLCLRFQKKFPQCPSDTICVCVCVCMYVNSKDTLQELKKRFYLCSKSNAFNQIDCYFLKTQVYMWIHVML